MQGWATLTDNVYIWHYVANFHNFLAPLPLLRAIGPKIRASVANHAKGLFMQGPASVANLGELRNYVICNLLWDPTRDENALIDEFLRLHYGPQADAVREYITIIQDAAEADGRHRGCFGRAVDYGTTPDVARRALAVLEKAMAATDDEVLRMRLERETLGCHAVFVDPVTDPAAKRANIYFRDDGTPFALDRDAMQAARPHLATFFALCRKHKVKEIANCAPLGSLDRILREAYGLRKKEAW